MYERDNSFDDVVAHFVAFFGRRSKSYFQYYVPEIGTGLVHDGTAAYVL
jgi:hypothetical protein